jgi:GINS complex subunit 3
VSRHVWNAWQSVNMATSSYYDLDAILTDSQKIPCTFELTVPSLGYLSGNVGEDVTSGAKLELPLWLGEMLAVNRIAGDTTFLTMDMPAALSKRLINALKADPKTVHLRQQAPHFYGLGARMLELFDEEELVEVLTETFKKRAVDIADKASNSRNLGGEGGEWMRGLDEEERALFKASHEGGTAVRKWFDSADRS